MANNIIQIIGIITSILTLVSTFAGFIFANRNIKFQAKATVDTKLFDINNLTLEITSKIELKKSKINDKNREIIMKSIDALQTQYLNAYEMICYYYLRHFISKKEFERDYKTKIVQMREDKTLSKILNKSTEYSAIKKVLKRIEPSK